MSTLRLVSPSDCEAIGFFGIDHPAEAKTTPYLEAPVVRKISARDFPCRTKNAHIRRKTEAAAAGAWRTE